MECRAVNSPFYSPATMYFCITTINIMYTNETFIVCNGGEVPHDVIHIF